MADVLDSQVSSDVFHDKVVLIGLMTLSGERDRFPVPVSARGSLMAGVEIQANAIETLIQNAFLTEMPAHWQMLLILSLAVSMSMLFTFPTLVLQIRADAGFTCLWIGHSVGCLQPLRSW